MLIRQNRGNLLVEDRNTAEGTAEPFGVIFLELGVHGFQEGTDEWHLEGRADDRTLVPDVADCSQFHVSRYCYYYYYNHND